MNNIECIGVGINYRQEIEADIVDRLDQLDLIEVITDSLMVDNEASEVLQHLMRSKPFVLHGLNASLGAAQALVPEYAQAVLGAVAQWQPIWFSDHIAFSRIGQMDVGHLMPVRRTPANLDRIVAKIGHFTRATKTPFLIENITDYLSQHDACIDEETFLNEILKQTGCGLLLDVNNLWINSRNHRFDPYAFLDRLNLDSLTQIHLAGGVSRGDFLVDSHGHRIGEPVWALLEFVCAKKTPRAIVVERDVNFDLDDIFDSVARAREILHKGIRSQDRSERTSDDIH